jgi:hypothetical protein
MPPNIQVQVISLVAMFPFPSPFPKQERELRVSFYNVGTGTFTFSERRCSRNVGHACSRSQAAKVISCFQTPFRHKSEYARHNMYHCENLVHVHLYFILKFLKATSIVYIYIYTYIFNIRIEKRFIRLFFYFPQGPCVSHS